MHWVLDLAFREDESRVRLGHADENLAVLRHISLNLLRQEHSSRVGIHTKRLKAGWDTTYLSAGSGWGELDAIALGSLTERLQKYRAELAYPEEHINDLPQSIDLAFTEARRRTSSFIDLPDDEAIDLQYLPEWEYDAAAYYKGNFRTQIVMNVASTATYISRLFDHKVCHEGYPGHHTEYVLKEQYLYMQSRIYRAINLPDFVSTMCDSGRNCDACS